MASDPEKIIAEMKSLIADSKRLHKQHSDLVLRFQKLNEELERAKRANKTKGGSRGLGRV